MPKAINTPIAEPAKPEAPIIEAKIKAPEPHRCSNCNRLLFIGNVGEGGSVETKCGKCGTLNTFSINIPAINFQDKVYLNRRRRTK